MYKMLIITEKVSRVKGMEVENKLSLFFVSKSIREYFAKPSSELIELSLFRLLTTNQNAHASILLQAMECHVSIDLV